MKPEQIYEELKHIAEKLGVLVQEQNFKAVGLKAKSGFCKVKEEQRFIIDKHKSIHKKVKSLASFVSTLPHESIYVIPAVREIIELNKSK